MFLAKFLSGQTVYQALKELYTYSIRSRDLPAALASGSIFNLPSVCIYWCVCVGELFFCGYSE